jgi:hypothetical protein
LSNRETRKIIEFQRILRRILGNYSDLKKYRQRCL